jgi:hypothetical protein
MRGKVYPEPEIKTCKANIHKERLGTILSNIEHDILEISQTPYYILPVTRNI